MFFIFIFYTNAKIKFNHEVEKQAPEETNVRFDRNRHRLRPIVSRTFFQLTVVLVRLELYS